MELNRKIKTSQLHILPTSCLNENRGSIALYFEYSRTNSQQTPQTLNKPQNEI